MAESYSVKAVLSAVDKNFSSTFSSAQKSISGIPDSVKKATGAISKIAAGIGVFKALSAGANLLSSSVSSAFSRQDTMEQFNRTITTITGNANAASGALEELKGEGMQDLVIDLRNNGGGLVDVTCNILDELLPEGLIVYTEDKYGNRQEEYSDAEHYFDGKMAVLVNGNSASASEIFAGAIKDYGVGTLIGTQTFGKGIVQSLFPLSDGSAIKITVSRYYTPAGNNIHEVGIAPDIVLDKDTESADDNQLQKAIEVLSE